MTRPQGKLLKASIIDDVVDQTPRMIPENSIKYRIYKYVMSTNKPLLTNDIHKKISPSSPRRVIERALTNLALGGFVKRERCICGCSFLYTK